MPNEYEDRRKVIEERLEREAAAKQANIKRWLTRGAALIVAALLLATSCTRVDTGTVGVVTHLGAVEPDALSEGVHFTRPWPLANVIEVGIAVHATEHDAAAASKDLQTVSTKVTVQWSIEPAFAPRMCQGFGYGEGVWVNGIMVPAIQEVVKAVAARFTAEELIVQREHVKVAIEQGLNDFVGKTLNEKHLRGAIRLANVAVTNFEFSKEFNASIEAKVKAEQDALKAVNEKTRRVTEAEAAYQEKKLAADAAAYTTETESTARAAAILRESKALESNPNLVQLRIAERWNGVLPTYTGGSIPLMQLPGSK